MSRVDLERDWRKSRQKTKDRTDWHIETRTADPCAVVFFIIIIIIILAVNLQLSVAMSVLQFLIINKININININIIANI